jgi:GNAT superfamily N-acetyltransferase
MSLCALLKSSTTGLQAMADLHIHPLTLERWRDLERLFGSRGACGGCWCTYWRRTRSQFEQGKGEGNRKLLRDLVKNGFIPGLLAYSNENEPIGWISVAKREEFPALDRSRVLVRMDDQPVWSVVCFFVAKGHRRKGVSEALLQAAVEFSRQQGARIVEGYPTPTKSGKLPDPFVYTGLEQVFARAGFQAALRRGKGRAIWRLILDEVPQPINNRDLYLR